MSDIRVETRADRQVRGASVQMIPSAHVWFAGQIVHSFEPTPREVEAGLGVDLAKLIRVRADEEAERWRSLERAGAEEVRRAESRQEARARALAPLRLWWGSVSLRLKTRALRTALFLGLAFVLLMLPYHIGVALTEKGVQSVALEIHRLAQQSPGIVPVDQIEAIDPVTSAIRVMLSDGSAAEREYLVMGFNNGTARFTDTEYRCAIRVSRAAVGEMVCDNVDNWKGLYAILDSPRPRFTTLHASVFGGDRAWAAFLAWCGLALWRLIGGLIGSGFLIAALVQPFTAWVGDREKEKEFQRRALGTDRHRAQGDPAFIRTELFTPDGYRPAIRAHLVNRYGGVVHTVEPALKDVRERDGAELIHEVVEQARTLSLEIPRQERLTRQALQG